MHLAFYVFQDHNGVHPCSLKDILFGKYVKKNENISLLERQTWFFFCFTTVQCHFNAIKFIQNIHRRQPIAHPLGRSMGCLWQSVWKSQASWARLGERNVKKNFFLTFRHSYNTCINVTNFYSGSKFLLEIRVISSRKSPRIMICMHSGEQKRQNGPENQMISKLCLENRIFFSDSLVQTVIDILPMFLQWCVQYHVILDCTIAALDCTTAMRIQTYSWKFSIWKWHFMFSQDLLKFL